MKRTLILGLILCSSLFFVSCGTDQNKTAKSNTGTESTETVTPDTSSGDTSDQTQTEAKKDDKTTDSTDEAKKDNSKDTNTTKKDTETKNPSKTEDSSNKDKTNTPSKDNSSSTNKGTLQDTNTDSNVSKYFGTWKISKVIGKTAISTNNEAPVGKTLVLGKDSYKNNATGITIDKPSYLESSLKSTAFAKGFNMQNLNGTGLKGNIINVIDITSSTNPNSAFDEILIQDGYIVYLQDGVFFKCTKM